MIKEEIAPGIVDYSNVIPNSENLYQDIEEGIISANVEWQDASVKSSQDNAGVDNMIRSTKTVGVPYAGKIHDIVENNISSIFFTSLNNLFFENFYVNINRNCIELF